jgi:hypothetical protein
MSKIELNKTAGDLILYAIKSMEVHLYDKGPIPHAALASCTASLREILIEAGYVFTCEDCG